MNDEPHLNEPQFGNRIRHLLNQSAPLDASIAAKLRAAREAALARQKPESAHGVTWAGGVLARVGGLRGLSLRLIMPVVALAVGFAAVYTWEQRLRAAEVEELDALVLTGELPIDAYLDRGFEAWLKKRASY
jgi:phage baseplate assembly protein W